MGSIQCFLIVTGGWITSLCLHEFAHAWVAYKGGDYTVREKGYLTLNPLRYTHPVYSFLMPVVFLLLGGIGLPGGAVYINHHLLRSRQWEAATSLAGPAANLALILLLGAVFQAGLVPVSPPNIVTVSLAFLLQLQVSAVLLNLLPVPPLDGFQAIAPWLPGRVRAKMYEHSNALFLVLFAVLWFSPEVNRAFWGTVHTVSEWVGVEPAIGQYGWIAYKFWEH